MTSRDTETSRPIHFEVATKVERMVIKGKAYVILNPATYPAGTYRLELDPLSSTGWINEESA